MNDRFLKACRREPVDCTPVWRTRAVILVVLTGLLACSQNPESSSPPKPEVAATKSTQPATESVALPKPEPVSPPNPELAAIKPFWLAGFDTSFLTPLLQYNKGRWSTPWPRSVDVDPAVPFNEAPFVKNLPSLAKVPPQWVGASPDIETWFVLTPTGQPLVLKAEKLVAYEYSGDGVEGGARVTIELASKADVARKMKELGLESGVATNVEAMLPRIVRFELLHENSKAWGSLRDFMQPIVLEKFKEYQDRKRERITWQVWQARKPPSEGAIHYFRAEMKYFATTSTEDCPDVAKLSGWIWSDKVGKFFLLGQEGGSFDCYRRGTSLRPLVGVDFPGSTAIIVETDYSGRDIVFGVYEFTEAPPQLRHIRL